MANYAKPMAKTLYKKGGPTRSQKARAKSNKTAARGAKAVDEGRERKATRLLKKAARQETRSIKLEEVEKKRKRRAKQTLVSSRGDFLNQVEKHCGYRNFM